MDTLRSIMGTANALANPNTRSSVVLVPSNSSVLPIPPNVPPVGPSSLANAIGVAVIQPAALPSAPIFSQLFLNGLMGLPNATPNHSRANSPLIPLLDTTPIHSLAASLNATPIHSLPVSLNATPIHSPADLPNATPVLSCASGIDIARPLLPNAGLVNVIVGDTVPPRDSEHGAPTSTTRKRKHTEAPVVPATCKDLDHPGKRHRGPTFNTATATTSRSSSDAASSSASIEFSALLKGGWTAGDIVKLQDGLKTLQNLQEPSSWVDLVQLWMTFETRSSLESLEVRGLKARKFPDGSKVCKRPAGVGDWVARARRPNFRPTTGSLSSYQEEFWGWWRSVLPGWQTINEGSLLTTGPAGSTWDAVSCSGPNGLLCVMAALYFWGMEVSELPGVGYRQEAAKTEAFASWLLAVDDVSLTFTCILAALDTTD